MPIKEKYLEELAFLEMEEIKDVLISFLDKCNISYELDFRVKSLDKIHQNQLLFKENNGVSDLSDIPDIIGFRISVDSDQEVLRIFDLLFDYFIPISVGDVFNHTNNTGYKAFSCYYDVWGINTEIQIMTKNMRDYINSHHEEHDNNSIRTRSLI